MSPWMLVLVVFLGYGLVTALTVLEGDIGTKYGLSFGYIQQGCLLLFAAFRIFNALFGMEAMAKFDWIAVVEMCRITRREMKAGAIGLSTGLIYMSCAYSETTEIIEMCKVVAEFMNLIG